eukprot:gene19625-biopygen34260
MIYATDDAWTRAGLAVESRQRVKGGGWSQPKQKLPAAYAAGGLRWGPAYPKDHAKIAAIAPRAHIKAARLGRMQQEKINGKRYQVRPLRIEAQRHAPQRAVAGVQLLRVLPPQTPVIVSLDAAMLATRDKPHEWARGTAAAVQAELDRRYAGLPPDQQGGRSEHNPQETLAERKEKDEKRDKQREMREKFGVSRCPLRQAMYKQQQAKKERQGERELRKKRQPPGAKVLRVMHWNINGVRSHITECKHAMQVYEPHAVLLQETKLTPGVEPPRFPGYDMLRADRPSKDGGGGLLILLREGLQWSPNRTARPGLHSDDKMSESLGCVVHPHRAERLPLLNLYIPPNTKVQIRTESLPTDALICADANAHHPAWDATGKVTDGRGR